MTHKLLAAAGAATLLALGAASTAQAAVIATLSFDSPAGIVANNVSIPVFLTLTLDALSDPMTSDAFSNITSPSPLPAQVITDLDNPASAFFNEAFFCTGNFTNGCGPSPNYAFNFNFNPPAFVAPQNFNLQPGGSYSFLFGNFDPVGGAAHGGLYTFYNAAIIYEGKGQDGLYHISNLAGTCPTYTTDCAFTRLVYEAVPPAGVPEPAAWALMIAGFAGAGAQLRRRRRLVQAV